MKNELEQAAATNAAQQEMTATTAHTDGNLGYHTDGTQWTKKEAVSESQMTALLTKKEGIPCQSDGTPYEYQDASPDALDNCNRQLATCSVWTAVWCGKCRHNGNVMYRMDHCGDRYYHYRDLVRLLGAPSQRAEKSEASKARKSAALAAQQAAAEQAAALAAAQAQLQRLQAAMAAAAKDGMTAAAMQAAMDKEDEYNALNARRVDYRNTLLARGNTPEECDALVGIKYPAPAEADDLNGEDLYDDESEETAFTAANGTNDVQVTSQQAKSAKKAVKTTKKSNK